MPSILNSFSYGACATYYCLAHVDEKWLIWMDLVSTKSVVQRSLSLCVLHASFDKEVDFQVCLQVKKFNSPAILNQAQSTSCSVSSSQTGELLTSFSISSSQTEEFWDFLWSRWSCYQRPLRLTDTTKQLSKLMPIIAHHRLFLGDLPLVCVAHVCVQADDGFIAFD